ncbi:MAG: hypothetical protein WBC53_11210 [Phycisphaerae bacterium]
MQSETSVRSKRNGHIRFLEHEYGSFRKEILDFFAQRLPSSAKTILDPMAGTAPLIPFAYEKSISAHFLDLLPLHYYVNAAKLYPAYIAFARAEEKRRDYVAREAAHCLRSLRGKRLLISEDWLHPDVLAGLLSAWRRADSYDPDMRSVIKAILVLCIRSFSCCTPSMSNHTWLKPGGVSTDRTPYAVAKRYAESIKAFYAKYYSSFDEAPRVDVTCSCGDCLDFRTRRRFDVILTSPPYPNRFEPERMYGPELRFFEEVGQPLDNSRLLATTRVRLYDGLADDLAFLCEVAPTTAHFIDQVRETSTPGEADYYPKYFTRYYAGLYRRFLNIMRYLRRDGRIFVAVQDNVHRGHLNEMGLYIRDFFTRRGFICSKPFEQLTRHYGLRNISVRHPLVLRKHREQIIEASR